MTNNDFHFHSVFVTLKINIPDLCLKRKSFDPVRQKYFKIKTAPDMDVGCADDLSDFLLLFAPQALV